MRRGSVLAIAAAVMLFAASSVLAVTAARSTPAKLPGLERVLATAALVKPLPTDLKTKSLPMPTPIVASCDRVDIHLPVDPKLVSLIAFHQAGSRPTAVSMRSVVTPLKPSAATTQALKPSATAGDALSSVAAAPDEDRPVYHGRTIKLWRTGREGDPDTAIDVGTKPGTRVIAPVSGTVVAVHEYMLYSEYDDYEIHIIPSGSPDLDCVVLHVTDPSVKVGQRVEGGFTPIAKVRWLSKLFASQLDDYTHDGGNHVHVQMDECPRPGVAQLMGGVVAEFGQPRKAVQPRTAASATSTPLKSRPVPATRTP